MARHGMTRRTKMESGTYVDGAHAHPDLESPIKKMEAKVARLEKRVSKLMQRNRRSAFAGK